MPRATVTAEETSRGLKFTTATESNGVYRVAGLPPSTYTLTVRIAGFQTEVLKGVVVNVGETTDCRYSSHRCGRRPTQVEVNAEPPVVETERGSQANTLNEQYIEDLPIDRRDYLTLYFAAARRLGFHATGRRSGFPREADAAERPFFLRQQRARQQRDGGRRRGAG